MKNLWNDTFNIKKLTSKEDSITGVLNPIHWDRHGRVKQFSIYSDEEEDVIIEKGFDRKKLLRLLNKRVLAKGKIQTNSNGDKFISLKAIKEVSGPTSPATHTHNLMTPSLWGEEYSISIPKEYAFSQYGKFADLYEEAC